MPEVEDCCLSCEVEARCIKTVKRCKDGCEKCSDQCTDFKARDFFTGLEIIRGEAPWKKEKI